MSRAQGYTMRKKFFPILLALVWTLLPALSHSAAQAVPATIQSTDGQQASEADTRVGELASLSDEQVRQLLLTRLNDEKKTMQVERGSGPAAFVGRLFQGIDERSEQVLEQMVKLRGHLLNFLPDLFRGLAKLGGDGGFIRVVGNILLVITVIGIGVGGEIWFRRTVLTKYFRLDSAPAQGGDGLARFWISFTRYLPEFLGIIVFFCVSCFFFFLLFGAGHDPVRYLFLAALLALSLSRFVAVCSKLIFSPDNSEFRLMDLEDEWAGMTHKWIVLLSSFTLSGLLVGEFFHRLEVDKMSVSLILLFLATGLLILIGIGGMKLKERVTTHLLAVADKNSVGGNGWAMRQFAGSWHILALLYLAVLWFFLVVEMANSSQGGNGAFIFSLFVVPIFIIMDRLGQWVVKNGLGLLNMHDVEPGTEDELDEEQLEELEKMRLLEKKSRRLARSIIIIAMGLWIAGLWGVRIPYLSGMGGAVFDIMVICTLALFSWRLFSSFIERKITENLPEDSGEEESEDEWGGGAAAGRVHTLLPMVRKFIGSVLTVMVVLVILSSMGVDIGPLLAGAGVVGLAVGFGAQKLVSDIFSGFFYLMDDAFRVGEYISAGSISGAVEAITLRNVMLRHHRGMLQIVPYSELGAITNFMRGGVVVKFDLNFPYDADIDKIRKIIKKTGQAMLKDEEFGEDFIRPVKSQGVREITGAIMTIRVKFTAKPGTHFVIRREAYKRITENLIAKGIHYAQSKVLVDLPPSAAGDSRAVEAAGAAAQAAAAEEAKKKSSETAGSEESSMPGM
ncbi:MAG: mechanosensitive ion channel domain-containing protein [Thermodesulfobacteriota bacterium]